MIIKYKGNCIRQTKFDFFDPIIPTVDAAVGMGFEILWEYDTIDVSDENPSDRIKILSDNYIGINLDLYLKCRKNYSIILFTHHTSDILFIPMQLIEYDWWVRPVEVICYRKSFKLIKDQPFVQGMIVPRREMVLKEMTREEIKKNKKANEFLDKNKNKFITREECNKDNLYEVLTNLAIRDKLPKELKEEKPSLGSRLRRL